MCVYISKYSTARVLAWSWAGTSNYSTARVLAWYWTGASNYSTARVTRLVLDRRFQLQHS